MNDNNILDTLSDSTIGDKPTVDSENKNPTKEDLLKAIHEEIEEVNDENKEVAEQVTLPIKEETPKKESDIKTQPINLEEKVEKTEDEPAFKEEDDLIFNNDGSIDGDEIAAPVEISDGSEFLEEKSSTERELYYQSYAGKIETKNRASKFLDNMPIDLNTIEITSERDRPALKKADDLRILFDITPTFLVVCCQSGYRAHMAGLTLNEKNGLLNSTSDLFDSKNRLFQTIYNKIVSMSFPKPSYNDWLKITSFSDVNTLLFGIYCQTFIDNNEFDITCNNCNKVTSVTVDNNSLVEARDKEMFGEKFNEIIANVQTIEDLKNISLLYKTNRTSLPESKLVVDIRIPSLYDYLSLLRKANPDIVSKYADSFSALMFIENMYIINTEATKREGRYIFYPETDNGRRLGILNKLSVNDGDILAEEIEDKLSKYRIGYEIHNVECMHCKQQLKNIPVDLEQILFTRLNRTRSRD